MKIVKKNRENLKKIAAEILVVLGFKRHGSSFVREQPGCFQIINFQGSMYNSSTYINQNVWFKEFGVKLPERVGSDFYQFSERMESSVEDEEPYWRVILDATNEPIDHSQWKAQIEQLLISRLPLFGFLLTLRQAQENHRAGLIPAGLLYAAQQYGA